jgi:cobalt-zinc-cadmium efflux system outer membrane protein
MKTYMPCRCSNRRHEFAAKSHFTVMMCIASAIAACTPQTPVVVAPRPLGRDIPVYRPAASDSGRPRGPLFANPSDTIALRNVIALSLLHSPDLAAFAWEVRAREARVVQAGRLPNPIVGLLAEDFGASRSSEIGGPLLVQRQTTVQLSQLIELPGKRLARLGLAARSRELAAWEYEAARMDVLTRVTHGFIDVLVAQEMVSLTRQTADLVQQIRQSVGARVVAGVVSPIEETKADVALASARVESDRALRLLDASRGRLATLWGSSEAAFRWAVGDLNIVSDLPSIATLRARLTQNPELARWAAEISQRQALLAVERSNRLPDLTITAGYRRFADFGIDAYLAGVSLPLPLFDRNQGGTAEATSLLNKAYEERRGTEARISAALSDAYRALSSAHHEVIALRETVLPGSRQTFEAVSEGYRLGKFGYLDVLDAQRTLVAAGGQYLRAVSDYHKAVADVERLIGAPLTGADR